MSDHSPLQFLDLLRVNGGWLTRRQLKACGYTDRDCRAHRQALAGAVIFGQLGFKATDCATLEEIHACANTLGSQAEEMQRERADLWRQINRRQERASVGADGQMEMFG